jgi:hypothetical protein
MAKITTGAARSHATAPTNKVSLSRDAFNVRGVDFI